MSIYLFDVDGTLTPARKSMTASFASDFLPFLEKNICYIISGSDLDKIKEQIPNEILQKFSGVFCSMGNEFFIKDSLIYSNPFIPEKSLIEDLEKIRNNTKYPYNIYNNYIEIRKGMLNFSTLGRDCKEIDREQYYQWDSIFKEREAIKKYLDAKYKDIYDISIGGQISIDITLKGKGKEQIIPYLRNDYPNEKFIFCGDKVDEGGNDYYIAKYCKDVDHNSKVISVSSPEQLIEQLHILSKK